MAREALMLLKEVRRVALRANPDEPTAATQGAFDAARLPGGTKGREQHGLPAARQIAAELQLPWRDVLALAHERDGRQAHALGLAGRQWLRMGSGPPSSLSEKRAELDEPGVSSVGETAGHDS